MQVRTMKMTDKSPGSETRGYNDLRSIIPDYGGSISDTVIRKAIKNLKNWRSDAET